MSYDLYRARRHFLELDGLRALCILAVVTVHTRAHWPWLSGQLGVVVFFVLSGFLITTLALREEAREGQLNLGAFMVRRAFRLFPAYYVVLALYVVLILGAHVAPERRAAFVDALPGYLFYYQELAVHRVSAVGASLPFYQSWSLGVEEKFYLLWPLVAFVALRQRPGARLWAALIAVPLFLVLGATTEAAWWMPPYAGILAGCAVAMLLHDPVWFGRLAGLGARHVVLALAVLVLTVQLSAAHVALAWSIFPLAVSVFLAGLVQRDGTDIAAGFVRQLLAWRPLVRIGELSYGIYLLHLLVKNVAVKFAPLSLGTVPSAVIEFALTVAGSIALAKLLQVTVESPAREFGRRVASRLQPRQVREMQPAPVLVDAA